MQTTSGEDLATRIVNMEAEVAFLFHLAGAPVDGAAPTGSFAGQAPAGALLIDTVNAKLYINTNTQLSPLWTAVGSQTS